MVQMSSEPTQEDVIALRISVGEKYEKALAAGGGKDLDTVEDEDSSPKSSLVYREQIDSDWFETKLSTEFGKCSRWDHQITELRVSTTKILVNR